MSRCLFQSMMNGNTNIFIHTKIEIRINCSFVLTGNYFSYFNPIVVIIVRSLFAVSVLLLVDFRRITAFPYFGRIQANFTCGSNWSSIRNVCGKCTILHRFTAWNEFVAMAMISMYPLIGAFTWANKHFYVYKSS